MHHCLFFYSNLAFSSAQTHVLFINSQGHTYTSMKQKYECQTATQHQCFHRQKEEEGD